MDVAQLCALCGAPSPGTRFCTSCGAPLAVVPQAGETPETAEIAGPVSGSTAVMVAPWVGSGPVPEPSSAPASASTSRRPDVLVVLVVAAMLLSGWAMVRGVEQHTLSGTVMILDSGYLGLRPGARCTGEAGYRDVGRGAQVVLRDTRGSTLSTGRLSNGEFDGLGCVFSFELEDVGRSDHYALELGAGGRGELQYSYEELSSADWSVPLSLGDG